VNRKRLIIGVAIFIFITVVLITLCGLGVQWWRKNHQPQAHQRQLISSLTYCGSSDIKPCIVSFSIDADGNMLVSLLTPDASYPDFYLTISADNNGINNYKCQKIKDFPTNVTCTGTEMYPGATLQFTLISLEDNTVLAEGKFAIIGLMLPNPSGETTETPSGTKTIEPIASPTPGLIEILTPLPTKPTSTALTPSYPNPTSYPNSSYP